MYRKTFDRACDISVPDCGVRLLQHHTTTPAQQNMYSDIQQPDTVRAFRHHPDTRPARYVSWSDMKGGFKDNDNDNDVFKNPL